MDRTSSATVEPLHGLERLGASDGFGDQLARLLELGGWTVERTTGFGGGVLVCLEGDPFQVGETFRLAGEGATFAEAIVEPFESAMLLTHTARRGGNVQLRLT